MDTTCTKGGASRTSLLTQPAAVRRCATPIRLSDLTDRRVRSDFRESCACDDDDWLWTRLCLVRSCGLALRKSDP